MPRIPPRPQEGSHPRGDLPRGDGAVPRARLRRRDDRAGLRGRGRREGHLLPALLVEGGVARRVEPHARRRARAHRLAEPRDSALSRVSHARRASRRAMAASSPMPRARCCASCSRAPDAARSRPARGGRGGRAARPGARRAAPQRSRRGSQPRRSWPAARPCSAREHARDAAPEQLRNELLHALLHGVHEPKPRLRVDAGP